MIDLAILALGATIFLAAAVVLVRRTARTLVRAVLVALVAIALLAVLMPLRA